MSTRYVLFGLAVLGAGAFFWLRSADDAPPPVTDVAADDVAQPKSSPSALTRAPAAPPELASGGRPKTMEELRARMDAREKAAREQGQAPGTDVASLLGPSTPKLPTAAAETSKSIAKADVTPEEAAVLEVYESMAVAFDRNQDNCKEMGVAIREFVDENEQAIQALARSRARMTPQEQAAATERLEREAADQLDRLRQSMRVGVSRCPNEPQIQEALLKLAELGAG